MKRGQVWVQIKLLHGEYRYILILLNTPPTTYYINDDDAPLNAPPTTYYISDDDDVTHQLVAI